MVWLLETISVLLADGAPEGISLPYEKLTLMGALVFGIVGFMRRWVVPGSFYDDLKRENEQLRHANEQLRQLGGTATRAAEQLASNQSGASSPVPHDTQGR